jgi:hypothetical protein
VHTVLVDAILENQERSSKRKYHFPDWALLWGQGYVCNYTVLGHSLEDQEVGSMWVRWHSWEREKEQKMRNISWALVHPAEALREDDHVLPDEKAGHKKIVQIDPFCEK